MRRHRRWVVLLLLALVLAGCARAAGTAAGPASDERVATVEPVEGSDIARVRLSPEAARRLGITTDLVRTQRVDGIERTVVPYAAVIYDASGDAFAYTNSAPLVFLRVPLKIDDVDDDVAVLTAGPPVGTRVVTVGVAELLGTETGVGGE